MSSNFNKVLNILKKFTKNELVSLFNIALDSVNYNEPVEKSDCPYCSSNRVILYGKKRGKQRFLCNDCKHTFTTTTHTIRSMSHQPYDVWEGMIEDTLNGNSLSYSEDRLGISHQVAFNMRHKILLSLQDIERENPFKLQDVTELDETFVLECYKGQRLPSHITRKPRKHGAKALKRGSSNEFICICSGAQRKSNVILKAVNRAKPSSVEVTQVFKGHIADGTLLLTDGLRSYNVLESVADCSIKNITGEKTGFYNLNTVNSLHSFVKDQYKLYRGVATKYINRYCTLFEYAFRSGASDINNLKVALLNQRGHMPYSISNVKSHELTAIA